MGFGVLEVFEQEIEPTQLEEEDVVVRMGVHERLQDGDRRCGIALRLEHERASKGVVIRGVGEGPPCGPQLGSDQQGAERAASKHESHLRQYTLASGTGNGAGSRTRVARSNQRADQN